jgi:hypothetical protein
VNIAEQSSIQSALTNGIAARLVVEPQPLNGAGKSGELPLFASNAELSSQPTQATNGYSAPSNARLTAIVQNARNAKYAENLCDSCVTAIAQSIAAMSHAPSPESIRGLDSISERRRQILSRNLALFAETQGSTDTIPTIASLSLLFGSVLHAIAKNTKQESNVAPGGYAPTRFLYQSKASRRERNAGLEGMEARADFVTSGKGLGNCAVRCPEHDSPLPSGSNVYVCGCAKVYPDSGHRQPSANHHPTVKPLALMQYLVRLTATPYGGVVLDPFMGSGTTGVACVLEGRSFVGIEREPEYLEIARRRIEAATLPLMREAAD